MSMIPGMTYALHRDVQVGQAGRIVTIPRGTKLADLDPDVKAQLAPDHFVDAVFDGEGKLVIDGTGRVTTKSDEKPKDWRTDEATLAHDARQAEATEQEAEERAQRKAAKNKET